MIDVSRSNEIDMNGKFYSSERKLFDEHPIYVDLFSTYLTEKKHVIAQKLEDYI